MKGIIISTGRVKAYEGLQLLCSYTGMAQEWCDALWEDLLQDSEGYEEFVFYLEHHNFRDKMKFCGYGLTDLFVWQMDRSNLFRDTGKNTAECNKELMVLKAFRTMLDMKKSPEKYRKKIEEGPGMDRFQ